MTNIDEMSINAIRVLSADAIQKANSGHPGLPLGTAPTAYELWTNHMNYNPANPKWENRDRFVLSGGHGSMLLYSLFHLLGIGNLSLDDVKNFRQMGSKTPGHPEYGHTVGVEATTGPLGQGMAMAVGMAMAEAHLASVFNKDGYNVVDHYTYVLGGDGCMMEGISSECFSLAGTLGLSKLIVFYDSNNISIEGSTDIAFTENVMKRFEAFGFQTIEVADGNDIEAIGKAIEEAKADKERPSLIKVNTLIGYGCPAKQGKASAHGEPLGIDNVAALKENLNWPCKGDFEVPQEVYDHYKEIAARMAEPEEEWNKLFAEYCEKFPEMKELWDKYYNGCDMSDLFNSEEYLAKPEKAEATRSSSGTILNMIKDNEIDDEQFLSMLEKVNEVIELSSIGSSIADKAVLTEKIDAVRNELISIMESVTDYVDKFRIYEHVLNRVEYRFRDDAFDSEYYNTYMTNDIMHYIFSDKDNVSINARISDIVGQLPVRMSKGKFYDHISEAFTLYHGAQKKTIDDFYYSLSTSAMLGKAAMDNGFFTDMHDIYVTLDKADYKNIDSAEYTRLKGALDIATEKMSNAADIYVLLAQIVNDLYTIILSENNTVGDSTEVMTSKDIIKKSRAVFEEEEDLDEIAALFSSM